MIPVVIAMAAISAYEQWQKSEDAKKATQAERDQIKALYDKIQSPNFDPNSITPAEYAAVREHIPQGAALVQEVAPTIIKQTADMEAGTSAQKSALQRYRDIAANNGEDPQMKALLDVAARKGQIEAQSRQQSVLQDANRRGMLGSGVSLAAQLSGSANAMDRAAAQGNTAAIEAYKGRLDALKNSAQLGGQLYNQNVDLQGKNANIINSFNARTSQNAQNVENLNTNNANTADKFNIENAQQQANLNTGAKNQFAQYNATRNDSNQQKAFQDQMELANAKMGLSNNQVADTRANAADSNNMVQGITNAAGGIYQNYESGQAADAEQDNQKRMAYYQKTGDKRAFDKNFNPFGEQDSSNAFNANSGVGYDDNNYNTDTFSSYA